jgi:UDP-N-acetylglucosamine enolpyruvyl transferase
VDVIPDIDGQKNRVPSTHDYKSGYLSIEQSGPLMGEVSLEGAKNAALVALASLLLTEGISTLRRIPPSADVFLMLKII